MAFWILVCLGLYVFNVYLAGAMLFARIGLVTYTGPRDALPDDSKYRARALKAANNFAESLPVFLALGLLALIVPETDLALAELGAMVFVLARVVYIPVYVAGLPFIRSIVYSVGALGLIAMLIALL
ncbi:MAG: MAPEG family protein [Pseudomonadota bacterium]